MRVIDFRQDGHPVTCSSCCPSRAAPQTTAFCRAASRNHCAPSLGTVPRCRSRRRFGYADPRPAATHPVLGACEQPMRELSSAGLDGVGRGRWARRHLGRRAVVNDGVPGDWQGAGPRCRPALDLTLNRVCPNSPHPSLCRAGGGAQARRRVLPMENGRVPPRARWSPGWHQAAGTTTVTWSGAAAPEAIAASQGTRRVTTTCSWRSSAAARAAWAWPPVSRLASRVVSWPCRAA
jgi:hypothetical protein